MLHVNVVFVFSMTGAQKKIDIYNNGICIIGKFANPNLILSSLVEGLWPNHRLILCGPNPLLWLNPIRTDDFLMPIKTRGVEVIGKC